MNLLSLKQLMRSSLPYRYYMMALLRLLLAAFSWHVWDSNQRLSQQYQAQAQLLSWMQTQLLTFKNINAAKTGGVATLATLQRDYPQLQMTPLQADKRQLQIPIRPERLIQLLHQIGRIADYSPQRLQLRATSQGLVLIANLVPISPAA